ncbi:hypothetical protein GO001_23580 [Streptomyces sp. NRRL B-1677]|uniref:Uncharacterized protein n=1 Tax=Streptomyces klenkii TaxID=1420899 RepID=A0A3B0BUB0_9ACTN|nr:MULTISPECIES: hypothetical protein [Streptomyces]MBF6048159.1 hypothetical protein [Streptomyces sp. NRRL B-1677]RKN75617.1 hypothetical protein D7231_09400 [Streptomyces klenkii]
MSPSTPRRLTAGAAALAGALTLGLGTLGSTAASAQALPALVRCTGGSFTMAVNAAAHGLGTLTNCSAPGHPGLTSGAITMSGLGTITDTLVTTTTTDKITWNTGEVTNLTEVREFIPTVGNRVREVGTGDSISGLFHPSNEEEFGRGTQSVNHAHDFTINNGLTVALFDGAL